MERHEHEEGVGEGDEAETALGTSSVVKENVFF